MTKKVAIVYDWLDSWGGVERILLSLRTLFPTADFYSSVQNVKKTPWAKSLSVRTSFIQKLPSFVKHRRLLSMPFYPYAFESFDFRSYDLVISVTSSFAKGIVTQPKTRHISYILTPPRFLWGMSNTYISSGLSFLIKPFFSYLKRWDAIASRRPDELYAISDTVRQRISKYYGQNSKVIYPPFDERYWSQFKSKKDEKKGSYYLVVSRLTQYKRVDLVIDVFNDLKDEKLIIVGTGVEQDRLHHLAKDNISFKENISDKELASLYENAQALIMPQEEDFGYVALEALFFGCPVIAYKEGGASETVLDGKTGIFFEKQSKQALMKALERFKSISYNLGVETRKSAPQLLSRFNHQQFNNFFNSL